MSDGSDPQPIIDFCRDQCGVVLGIGIGALGCKAIRIAHMGHVNAPMILGTLSVVETALTALDVPHGKGGVQAAIEHLRRGFAVGAKKRLSARRLIVIA